MPAYARGRVYTLPLWALAILGGVSCIVVGFLLLAIILKIATTREDFNSAGGQVVAPVLGVGGVLLVAAGIVLKKYRPDF